jgi:GTPase SAR1 family protein
MNLSANPVVQWISEVMHFCPSAPKLLIGCKKDLRRDPRVIEELKKTNEGPVTPKEVCCDSTRATVLTKRRIGSRSGSADWGRVLPRMLRSNWRGCSGRVQLRDSCRSPPHKGNKEVPRLVARASVPYYVIANYEGKLYGGSTSTPGR